MGNEHGKEHDPNGHGHTTPPAGTGEKVKKSGKKDKKKDPSPAPSKPGLLKDIDTSRLKHEVTDPIEDYYTVTEKVLGRGNFSTVKLGINKETQERCAIKIIDKSLVKNKPEMLSNEVDILLRAKHSGIIGLLDLFDTPDKMMLCMELVSGGELFDRIVEREQFTEAEARFVMAQLFDALAYLHSMGIVHRDLKPENLLLANEKDDIIKIADFGLSKIYTEEMMSTACGTPGYVAPEILQCEGYDKQIDMWSAGVIMYILLCGYPPFYNENDGRLFESIMAGQYEFHSPYWDNISVQAKDLIRKLLVVNPQQRLTADQAAEHEWFKMDKAALPKKGHGAEFREQLQKHNSTRKASMAAIKTEKAQIDRSAQSSADLRH